MFFEYKKAKNMYKMNEDLHIFGFFIIRDIEEKRLIMRLWGQTPIQLKCAALMW